MAQPAENNEGLERAIEQVGRIISGVLRTVFQTAAAKRPKAPHLLNQFNNVTQRGRAAASKPSSKIAFNISAIRASGWSRFKELHLPTPKQFSIMREFYMAKNTGSRTVHHVAGEGASIIASQSRPSMAPST